MKPSLSDSLEICQHFNMLPFLAVFPTPLQRAGTCTLAHAMKQASVPLIHRNQLDRLEASRPFPETVFPGKFHRSARCVNMGARGEMARESQRRAGRGARHIGARERSFGPSQQRWRACWASSRRSCGS